VSKINFENWTNALESHIEFFDKSPLNFRYEFAGLKFLGTHREQSSSTRIRLPSTCDLSLEPLRQVIVDVAIPSDMFDRLTPSLRSGSLVRLRPLLFAQVYSTQPLSLSLSLSLYLSRTHTYTHFS